MRSIMRKGNATKICTWNSHMGTLILNSLDFVHLGRKFAVISEEHGTL